MHRATRCVPLVFAGGDPEKVARVRQHLPDATYTGWNRIRSTMKRAIKQRPSDPIVPGSGLAGYAGTPLPKKLGVRAGSVVALVGAAAGFESVLGTLPTGAVVKRTTRGQCDLVIWFVRSRSDLERGVKRLGSAAGSGGLWILWPKKASGVASDLSQTVVRAVGLGAGLVDYKVCSVDETWSGLRFAKRSRK
jgi:hypothetical protein